jgi:glycosyltransferase involved in cell wall biosynthesis
MWRKKDSADTAHLLSIADNLRDSRQWPEAQEAYRAYLAEVPSDAGIWVQLGHTLKEDGLLAEAEVAYLRGLELKPAVADTLLQLGHLYKLRRDVPGAVASYRQALSLDAGLLDARSELRSLGFSADLAGAEESLEAGVPKLLINLSDLFFYLHNHQTASGIQRVQLGIAKAIIDGRLSGRHPVQFLAESADRRQYVRIEPIFVTELCHLLAQRRVVHDDIKTLMQSAIQNASEYMPCEGDIFLMLGAFWVIEDVTERIISLKRRGVVFGTLVYDIIPITHPEFCERSLTDSFTAYFHSVLGISDFVLAISTHSAEAVAQFMASQGLPVPPIRTLPLAHITWEAAAAVADPKPALKRLLRAGGLPGDRPFVPYISTVEIRKNHIYLFRIWKRLLETCGDQTPYLVFVGRPGWRVRDLMDQLDSTGNLGGAIVFLDGLSDSDLSLIYQNALFTVFPSFVEGWGLPIGESLCFGRPCLASNTSSIPEVGGEFVDYFDPFNVNDGYEKIRRFIVDPSAREERARHIKSNFAPRRWSEVAANLIGSVDEILDSPDFKVAIAEPPRLTPGRWYEFGHSDDMAAHAMAGHARVCHFAFDTNWYPIEAFGRWMRGRRASLQIAVRACGEGPATVVFEVCSAPWLEDVHLEVVANGRRLQTARLTPGGHQYIHFEAAPIDDIIEIELTVGGTSISGPDPRQDLAVGAVGLAYSTRSDLAARLEILERLALATPNAIRLKPAGASGIS